MRSSIEKDSGLSGDDLNAEYQKLTAAGTIQQPAPPAPAPRSQGIPPPPAMPPGSYNPEAEQNSLRSTEDIPDLTSRLHVQALLKQKYANDRIMDGVTQNARQQVINTAISAYSRAIQQIRDDPKAGLEQKHNIVTQLTKAMWNDPRLQYGETQGKLESYMEKLAFGEDAENLGPQFSKLWHGMVTGELRTHQQVLEARDNGAVSWAGAKQLITGLDLKDKPDARVAQEQQSLAFKQIEQEIYKDQHDTDPVTGQSKPSYKQMRAVNDVERSILNQVAAAGGDLDKVAKIVSSENVDAQIEATYPRFARRLDYMSRGAPVNLGGITVPGGVAEASRTAYQDIAAVPPTVPDKDGKMVPMDRGQWQIAINGLLENPARAAGFAAKFQGSAGVPDPAYILKSIHYTAPPPPPPVITPAAAPAGPGFFSRVFSRDRPEVTPHGFTGWGDVLEPLTRKPAPAPSVEAKK
jgi:hypothetical protein